MARRMIEVCDHCQRQTDHFYQVGDKKVCYSCYWDAENSVARLAIALTLGGISAVCAEHGYVPMTLALDDWYDAKPAAQPKTA